MLILADMYTWNWIVFMLPSLYWIYMKTAEEEDLLDYKLMKLVYSVLSIWHLWQGFLQSLLLNNTTFLPKAEQTAASSIHAHI